MIGSDVRPKQGRRKTGRKPSGIANACREANVPESTVHARIARGMALDEAIASARSAARPYATPRVRDGGDAAEVGRLLNEWQRSAEWTAEAMR